ncbi:MAG: sodium:solute symporter [Planctomycetaceae bacterium]
MSTFAADDSWTWLGLQVLDWVVLAAYFVAIMGIGIWSYRRVKDMSDYFMGGRRFGKIFMMFFAFGAGTSSEQAVTVVAGTWRVGLAGIWWQLLWVFATPFYWIVAPVMRRMRALTTADFFESRFGKKTAALYSIYGIVISVVFLASLLYASGKMVNALTGGELDRVAQDVDLQAPTLSITRNGPPWEVESWNVEQGTRPVAGYEFAVLAMTVMFVIYGMAGGLEAAILTDFIQGILTIAFSFLLLPFVFRMIDGFGSLHEHAGIKDGMLNLVADAQTAAGLGKEPLTLLYVFMLSLTALAGIVVQPHIMGVCGAGKIEFEGRFGFTVGNFLKRFCTMAWTFTGLACVVWYLGAKSPLLHIETPLDKTSAAFQQLDDDGKKRVRELSDDARKKIEADIQLHADLQKRAKHEEFSKLSKSEKERIDKADKKFGDELFGRAAYDILPAGLLGLLLASLLAAMMSSGDAQMVVSSGLFTDNIYRRFLVRKASQRHYLWVGRIAGLLIVVVALALQSTFHDVIDAIKLVLKTPAAIGISLWFGIVWRRWNTFSVWASTLGAAGTWFFVANEPETVRYWLEAANPTFEAVFPGWTLDVAGLFNPKGNLFDVWQMVAYLSAGVLSGIIVSLITPRPNAEKLNHFFSLIHTPVKPGEKPEAPCTLPADRNPQEEKLFNLENVEIPKPTWVGIGGFILAWICVAVIIWLTMFLAETW